MRKEGVSESAQSSWRVKNFMKLSRVDTRRPTIEGIDRLPDSPCVIATTHLSDIDVGEVATAVAEVRKIGVVSHITNLEERVRGRFFTAAGSDNFFPLTNFKLGTDEHGQKRESAHLIWEDLLRMEEGIKSGRTMVVAAYNPAYEWKLPNKPGMAAVALAHLTGVPVVPAVVDIKSPTLVGRGDEHKTRVKNLLTLNRPEEEVIFSEPITFGNISREDLKSAVGLYSLDARRSMDQRQIESAKSIVRQMRHEGAVIMASLASHLPPEKRGIWEGEDK